MTGHQQSGVEAMPEAGLPDDFELKVQRVVGGLWAVTTDAHPGFLHVVPTRPGGRTLAEGLAEVPADLAHFLRDMRELEGAPHG